MHEQEKKRQLNHDCTFAYSEGFLYVTHCRQHAMIVVRKHPVASSRLDAIAEAPPPLRLQRNAKRAITATSILIYRDFAQQSEAP